MSEDRNEFSVARFYRDGTYEYVCRWVDGEAAVRTFAAETLDPPPDIVRVIITDGGDFTNMEWKYRQGVTYPPGLRRKLVP